MARMELSQRLDLAKLGFDTGEDTESPDAAGDQSSATKDGDVMAQLAALIAKVGVVEDAANVAETDTLDSLGVDSLTRIELAVRAEEHFGKRVDDGVIGPSSSMKDLAAYFSDGDSED